MGVEVRIKSYPQAAGDGIHPDGRPPSCSPENGDMRFMPIIRQVVRIGNEQSPYVAQALAGAHNSPLPVKYAFSIQ